MIALINDQVYNLNSYYTEQTTGRLHLYIENSQQYDLDDLEANIQESNDIKIYNYSLQEEPTAILRGYTLIRHLEKQYEMNNQIYLFIDVENFQVLIDGLRQDVNTVTNDLSNIQTSITNIQAQIQNVSSQLAEIDDIKSRLSILENEIADLQAVDQTPVVPDPQIEE